MAGVSGLAGLAGGARGCDRGGAGRGLSGGGPPARAMEGLKAIAIAKSGAAKGTGRRGNVSPLGCIDRFSMGYAADAARRRQADDRLDVSI
ncbi:MAG: hypothetical protein Fur0042_21010 [Cyanophyceae cyanobacterium]